MFNLQSALFYGLTGAFYHSTNAKLLSPLGPLKSHISDIENVGYSASRAAEHPFLKESFQFLNS